MPEFDEQLKTITTLRENRRQCDEALYRARIEQQHIKQQLRRAQQSQTINNPERDREVATLRNQIARINARLSVLREEARQIEQSLFQLTEQVRLIEHLRQNLTAAQNRLETLREQLAELQQQEPRSEEEIRRIESELDRLESAIADLNNSLESANNTLHQMQDREQTQRETQQALQSEMETIRENMRELQASLTELLQPAYDDPQALSSRQTELESAAERFQTDLVDCNNSLNAAINSLYQENPHPKEALRNLDDRTPFLLFPVRLETIFVPTQSPRGEAQTELWVRIYPDDIVIQTHEKTLSDREIAAGELYWTELVTAEHLRTERDNRRGAAWRYLVELFGGQRASWIARQTKPSDWVTLAANGAAQTLPDFLREIDPNFFNNLLALPLSDTTRTALQKAIADNDGDAFSRLAEIELWFDRVNAAVLQRINGFPTHDLTKTDGWTQAPRTQVLPDRFVLILYGKKTDAPREIPGALIPDTLFLGPDPLDAKAGFKPKENGDGPITFAGEFDWMADFDKAVSQGMGFRVSLTAEESRNGFEQIFVLGVFLSANAADSATMVEELIDNHQFSPKGFSIVPQGTPTNNTERNGTGYSDNDPYNDLAFFIDTAPPAFDPTDPDPKKSQTDGRLLADALGIAYTPLQTVQKADQTDLLEAKAMNTALFTGTLGYWLHTWMAPVMTQQAARQTRSFFTRFVSGRGSLPAIRVGNQPYGILLTSDFSRWTYPERDDVLVAVFDDEIRFLKDLYRILSKLEKTWKTIAETLPFVGQLDSNPSEVLMNILGLHPTSVEFFQRIGFSDTYLKNLENFKRPGSAYTNELASLLNSMPPTVRLFLRSFGFEKDTPTVGKMRSLHVLWQHYVTQLDVPNLVENKPPSETNPLTYNYIDWLAKADDTQTIVDQNFAGSPPSALLYLMLRNALLLQLHYGAYEWLQERTTFDPKLEVAIKASALSGMRNQTQNLSKLEVMATHVEAAESTHPSPATSVADWIWRGSNPVEVEAAFLREQKAVLPLLAPAPTARLERCFVEHLDCCNYRLDAWQTGLFAQRLQAQRGSVEQQEDRQRGIYIGAFGWVEHVSPKSKTFIDPENLPSSLKPNDAHPVLEEDDVLTPGATRSAASKQGGFVHAPSLNHASAAALLRNAYLSYAKPEQAEMFSINLSSERVRRAQSILEGMRNGQPIEALLGYQFERGLHDRTSESAARGDIPVLELNQFILPYREAFPFESREVAQPGTGGVIETVPAYNVVNGLRLMQATLSSANGYGLNTINPPITLPNINQGNAILAEQSRLLDTLDSAKDLLMAENAYQLVQGNFDRVAAVSLAQKEAHIPPELQVIDTPRGTEFTFTNRVTLHFEDLDPSLPINNPWPSSVMTPRAIAETGMNYWLGQILGTAPNKVLCHVHWVEKTDKGKEIQHDTHLVSMADLAIQPIDFVWMVSISPEDTQGATELETRIAYHYRRNYNINDDKTVRIKFNPTVDAGEKTFAQLFPLARQLRALLSGSRALHAGDFLPASGGKATAVPVDKNNPKGYDVAELRSRIKTGLNMLDALLEDINSTSAPPLVELILINDPENVTDDERFTEPLGKAYQKLEEVKLTFTDTEKVNIRFSLSDAEILNQKLQAIANFGILDAFPSESDLSSDRAKAELLARAHRVARRLRSDNPKNGILDRAHDTFDRATPDKSAEDQVLRLLEAGKILFGETFDWLPKFIYHNEIDLTTANADRSQLLKYAVDATPGITEAEVVEEWLQGLARVRPNLHRWEIVRTLADALNDMILELHPVQVPYRKKDSWLSIEFPKNDPIDSTKPFGISRDTLSIAGHGASAFKSGLRQSGVLLDDWTEEIPTEQEITGIAFRFNQPNAAPPQTLLLAVTPQETGSWNWDDLVGTLRDTLDRAKRRAVEPEQLEEKQGLVWNALWPALVSEFSTLYQSDVSLDLMLMQNFTPLTQFYSSQVKIN